GYNSHIGFDPDRKFGFIVLVNQAYQCGTGLAVPFGKTIADLLQGRPDSDYPNRAYDQIQTDHQEREQSLAAPKNSRPPRAMEAYIGTYDSQVMGSILIRSNASGDLVFDLGPHNIPVSLSPYSGDIFLASIPVPTYDGRPSHVDRPKVKFVADGNDDIIQLTWLDEANKPCQPVFERRIV